jgi:hypothetical protein
MDTSRTARPIVPEDLRSIPAIRRAAYAAVQAAAGSRWRDPVAAAGALWPSDRVTVALLRGTVGGARTDTAHWAQELINSAVADFLAGLAPASAAAELMARSVSIPLTDDFNAVAVPYAPTVPAGGYIGEGLPIPAVASSLTVATLTPAKSGIAVMLSRELARAGGQAVINQLLTESAALTVDTLVFDINAPGLLAGLSPLPSTGPLADLGALAEAVGGSGSSGTVLFVAGTAIAAHLGLRVDHKATVFPSGGIPANRLIAVDPRALVFGAHPAPEISASEHATWHMSDTPAQIGTAGSPTVVAAPTVSSYQTGNVILRLLLTTAWATRSATAVAYVDTSWSAAP